MRRLKYTKQAGAIKAKHLKKKKEGIGSCNTTGRQCHNQDLQQQQQVNATHSQPCNACCRTLASLASSILAS
jgi:hypothetical protein